MVGGAAMVELVVEVGMEEEERLLALRSRRWRPMNRLFWSSMACCSSAACCCSSSFLLSNNSWLLVLLYSILAAALQSTPVQ